MENKLEVRINKTINCNNLDKVVEKVYGIPYSFQQQDGCKYRGFEYVTIPSPEPMDYNRETIPFQVNGNIKGVSFEAWKNVNLEDIKSKFEYDFEENIFFERSFYPHLDQILNDLHNKGLIEAGEYQIEINW